MWYCMVAGLVFAVMVLAAFYQMNEPCPQCGSRLRDNNVFEGGQLADAKCGRCGKRWTPKFVARERERANR